MIDQQNHLKSMKALLEDLKTAENYLRTAEQTAQDGQDVWIGLGRLGDMDAGKELLLKPLLPKSKTARQAIVRALEAHMPAIREEVLSAVRKEYNARLSELEKL